MKYTEDNYDPLSLEPENCDLHKEPDARFEAAIHGDLDALEQELRILFNQLSRLEHDVVTLTNAMRDILEGIKKNAPRNT